MRIICTLKSISLFLIFLCLSATTLRAADESYMNTFSGKIKKGDELTVIDDKFLSLPLEQWNQIQNISVDNIISFELRHDTAFNYFGKPFSCTLNISVKYFTSRDQQAPTQIDDIDLVVKYDTASGKFYPVDAQYSFKNAFKVTVVVNSISSAEWGDQLPDIFRIKNQILVKRKYPFDPHATAPFTISTQPTESGAARTLMARVAVTGTSGNYIFSWQAVTGAEEYDLEWTYVDGQSDRGKQIAASVVNGSFNLNSSDLAQWMEHDNTRLTVTGLSYSIQLPYTDGYMIARVRGVSYNSDNLRITGDWQYTDDQNHISCTGVDAPHEPNLNWQYTGTFAEEGKHKQVVTYFDGSLRNRQSVTLSNSTGKAVVAETIYDQMGRGAISVLPAPMENSKLGFNNGITISNTRNAPYNHMDVSFPGNGPNCTIGANPMSTMNGAARYYSLNNPFLDKTKYKDFSYFTNYVPDAGGFPFDVTEYTPDNTGRIRRQGGVGPMFQIGSGHETQYFYSKPLPRELERLFGMEVGNASHYLKNIVIDPNGQISLSYVDASGKTIATALEGKAPDNTDALPSSANAEAKMHLNQVLIRSMDIQRDASTLQMSSSAVFFAAVTGTFQVHYNIDPASIKTIPTNSPAFCSNCYYEVKIKVTNDCGDPVAETTSQPFTGNDMTCHDGAANFIGTLDVPIQKIGEYTVNYSLQLSEQIINQQVDYYIKNNTDLKTLQNFFQDEMLQADLKGCYSECSTCMVKLGSPSDFATKMNKLLGDLKNKKYSNNDKLDLNSTKIQGWISNTYTDLLAHCQAISSNCKPQSPCEQKLEMMKSDVRPGGQYAMYDETIFTVPSAEQAVSVLVNYKTDSRIPNYAFVDENGQARHIKDADVTEDVFIKAYIQHPEWADAFVLKHIEYCSYQWCKDQSNPNPAQNNEVSFTFDETLKEQFPNGQDAVAKGYYDRNNIDALLNNDPFFNGGYGTGDYKTSMHNDLSRISNVIKMTMKDQSGNAQPSKNIFQLVDWMLYCKPTSSSATAADAVASWNNCVPTTLCRSLTAEWELYRNYYLQLKSKYVEMAKRVKQPDCVNCFIGDDGMNKSGVTLGQVNANDPGPCPIYSEFVYDERPTYGPYSSSGGGVDQYEYEADIYYKHAGGPVSRPIKLTVYFYDQEDYYASGILSSYEVSMDAGQSEVYVGHIKRNYNVDAQEGHYYYYTYQECYIDENSIICNQPTSCTTTLTNSATKEVLLTSNFPTSSIACNGSDEFDAFRWTNNNIWLSGRSLLQFDLSGIPANATITSAKISLYAHPFSQNGNKTVAMYGNNSSYLQRVTSDWQCGLTWNIMPGTTITNEVLLSQSSSSNQDYTGIDITAMVKDMMSAGNYGIMLKQAIESDQNYHSMIFYGPSASDPSKRPKLDICYTVPPVPLPSSECKDDSRYPLYANKIRIFNDYINMEGYLNYLSQNQNAVSNDQALASAKTYALSNLSDLKDEWKNTLQEVRDEEFDKSTIGDDKISQIVDNLYLIAKYHIDQAISIDKVYPTRALPGNLTINNYHDFKSVFLGVLGKPIVDKGFGADLISQPYPEGKEPVVANLSSGDLTPQICSNISALRARFGTGSDLNFHNWLKTELQDDYILTFSQFQDILSRCANNCRLLDQPVALPVAFTAPSGQAWKVCDTVSFYKNRFAAEYPSVVPDTKLYRVLLANYLNFNLGYALSYDEYSDFIKSCANNSGLVLYNKPASPLLQNNDDACTISVLAGIFDRAGQEYVQYIETKRKEFRNQLVSKCLSNTTSLNLEGDQYEYHYTLYYYDQSGNLVKTIPPEGVKLLTNEEMDLLEQHLNDDVVQCDGSGVPTTENHIATFNALSTALQYNNIHGMDMWWYDRNNGDRQVRFITPDQKYFYQAAIANKKLWVEMYALVPGTGEISIVNSNKAVADISSIPVQNWSHLFVQTPLAMLKNPVPANTALTLGSSYTNTTTLASITNNFTVELWVNPTTPHEIDVQGTTGYPGISGEKYVFIPPWGGPSAVSQAGMGISVGTNGVSVYEHADNYMPATLVWSGTISGWTHVAVVYNNRRPQLYINGSLVKTGLTSPKATVYPGTLSLGGSYGVMNGQVDEARIWSYPRSQSEIQATMNTTLLGNESGLAAYWPINKEDHPVLVDLSSGGHDVTLPSDFTIASWSTGTPVTNIDNTETGQLQLYLDGHKLTNLSESATPAYPFEWEVSSSGGITLPLEEVAVLKHLRIYDRVATDPEVMANYKNGCLSPVGALAIQSSPLKHWGRFNIPAPGSETTVGAGSTVEQARYFIVPDHTLPTNYSYNSLNQVVKQSSPDGGTSQFFYDRLGRLSVSQNAEQKQSSTGDASARYSYTIFDALGRIQEVGEKLGSGTVDEGLVRDDSKLHPWLASGTNRQVTITAYDKAPLWAPASLTGAQHNLRKRVAATALVNTATPAADGTSDGSQNRLAASYYSYDAAGNVGDLYQENTTQSTTEKQYIIGTDGLKHLQYEYDLVSGKVNKVLYQPGKWDQFYYRYKYDDDNRLTDVYSSRINYTSSTELTNWVPEAHYTYYLHGPLARVELGKHKVQGLDYAYTLQGWLKGVNTQKLDGTSDIAGDGISGSDFSTVARDAIGFSLGYYNGDYTPIGGGSANAFGLKYTGTDQKQSGASLFNGNISHATYAIQGIDGGNTAAYSYRYDQLNRLIGMNRHQIGTGSTTWNNSSIIEAYKEKITYDGNGNILTYLRNGANSGSLPLEMDDLNYGYNKDASGRLLNNRLRHVKDRIADNKYTEDIDNQPDDNYLYDGIGNLIKDGAGSIDQIKWTVYGKIESIQKKDGTKISYVYDVSGNRISKTVSTSSSSNTTYYVRDAQGNVLGVYNQSGAAYNWQEQDLYGSSRLGMLRPNLSIASSSPLGSDQYNSSVDPVDNGIEGVRTYELTNHLSNVLATITDRKIGVDLDGNGTIDYYKTDVTSAQDYYPFGMQMPGRVFNNGSYRYGFNGKENDNEVKGVGNQQDYGMRVYDPRLGKFLSVDPLTRSYPQLTPYQYASNTPIAYIDLDGLEKYHYTLTLDDQGNSHIKLVSVENFSEWQWKPKLGGTFLGFQLWEEVKNPRKEFIVEYNFKDIVVVGAAAGQVDTKLSLTFNSEADALKANINDFESQFRNLDIAKGLLAGINMPGIPRTYRGNKVIVPEEEVSNTVSAAHNGSQEATESGTGSAGTNPIKIKHKNSNDAEGNFVLYDIHDGAGKQGQLLKIGKADADNTHASGVPVRMRASERKARKAGYPNATATVRRRLGKTTTKQATDAEAGEVKQERANGNPLPLNKEKSKKYKS